MRRVAVCDGYRTVKLDNADGGARRCSLTSMFTMLSIGFIDLTYWLRVNQWARCRNNPKKNIHLIGVLTAWHRNGYVELIGNTRIGRARVLHRLKLNCGSACGYLIRLKLCLHPTAISNNRMTAASRGPYNRMEFSACIKCTVIHLLHLVPEFSSFG